MNRTLFVAGVILLASATDGPDAAAELAVGKPAPDFDVTGIDGQTFKLSDKTKAGKNVALMFSRAHW